MTFKTGDKGKTRGGYDYQIVAVLDDESVIAILTDANEWNTCAWLSPDGLASKHHKSLQDLVPPKQEIEGYLRIYENGRHRYASVLSTDTVHDGIVAIVPITIPYTEGEGL